MSRGCGCGKILHGAAGLAKAALHIDRADGPVILRRRAFCRNCIYSTRRPKLMAQPSRGLTNFSKCLRCGCNIAAKTVIQSETCPLGLW